VLGNRTFLVEHPVPGNQATTTTRYTYSSAKAHQLKSMTRTLDEGASSGVGTFVYDGAGNLTERWVSGTGAKRYYTWDGDGELAAADLGAGDPVPDAGGEATFVYDASGTRLTRTDATGTTVYLPGGQELTVTKGTGVVTATRYYTFTGATVAVRTGKGMGAVTSIVADAHGTALVSIPNTQRGGTLTRRYSDPFGATRTATTSTGGAVIPGDRGFLGATRDDPTGLTLLGARYYDQVTARFISVDPQLDPGTPAQFNAYVYSGNNPMTWSDP
ncbi:RHS repeat-associated core domain-containing protein, partial [Cellulomonas composti]|uniref:RHS repeat-associated core domain-containing protein n=1 Tax=Cellulomonas composti TaxID=266130 RepID=UPI0011BF82B2